MQHDSKSPEKPAVPPSGTPGAGGRVGSWDPSSAADAMGIDLPRPGVVMIPRHVVVAEVADSSAPTAGTPPPNPAPAGDAARMAAVLTEPRSQLVFPTPLVSHRIVADGLNAALAALVLERSKATPNPSRRPRPGWQSASDLFAWSVETATLGRLIAEAVASAHPSKPIGEIERFGWANVFARGGYLDPHAHADAAWTGVYYVDAGDSSPDAGGMLMLRDPRAGAGMVASASQGYSASLEVTPRTGELLVFPSWLVHWVTPYDGVRPRISVSFGAR